jgi:hypothetical protein
MSIHVAAVGYFNPESGRDWPQQRGLVTSVFEVGVAAGGFTA